MYTRDNSINCMVCYNCCWYNCYNSQWFKLQSLPGDPASILLLRFREKNPCPAPGFEPLTFRLPYNTWFSDRLRSKQEEDTLKCEFCGFKSKSRAGHNVHLSTCKASESLGVPGFVRWAYRGTWTVDLKWKSKRPRLTLRNKTLFSTRVKNWVDYGVFFWSSTKVV